MLMHSYKTFHEMKRFLTFAALLLLPLLTMAQKKVAVWETKCTDNSVSSFQRIMVRGGMESAVANAPGYTGYDRASFDAIINEHNFQRSGAVSESDIKRLGEMAGVQYIIVPEAMVEGNDFYIIVKMLDVETGEFGAAYDALCAASSVEIRNACSQLGAKLFGNVPGGNSSNSGAVNLPQRSDAVTFNVGNVDLDMVKELASSILGSNDNGSSGSSSQAIATQGYVDLGLPSGTLWKDKNEEGLYTYDQAVNRFGNKLPTKEQYEELKNKCRWTWTDNGYKVVGPNGKSIVLPAKGYRDCSGSVYFVGSGGAYWSSTLNGSANVWALNFISGVGVVTMGSVSRCSGDSVRLVQY